MYLQPTQSPWVVGFSGGKDSTILLQLVIEAIQRVPPDERRRDVYVVCNDTLVESPIFQRYVESTLEVIRQGLDALALPVTVVTTRPKLSESFWVNFAWDRISSP